MTATEPTQVPPPPGQTTSPSATWTPGSAESAEVHLDDVETVRLTDDGSYVDVTVRVDGPPSAGTRHLLVAQFRGQYELKGQVPSSIGTHVVPVDLRRADPGSWRDFFIVGAGAATAAEWEASRDEQFFAMPEGSIELTEWKPHQMPRAPAKS